MGGEYGSDAPPLNPFNHLATPSSPILSALTSLSLYVTRDVISASGVTSLSHPHHNVTHPATLQADWTPSLTNERRSSRLNDTGFDFLKGGDDEEGGPGFTEDYPAAWLYASPALLGLGVVGNVLTFLVMRRARLRGTATSVYLQLLAVADTLALLSRIGPEFFKALRLFVFSEINRWTCKFEKFIFYTSSDVAIWILVLFTLDRLVAVCFPLSRHARASTPRRAALLCLLVASLATLKNLHVFWTRDVELGLDGGVQRVCGRPPSYFFFEERVRPWLAFVLISVVPCCVILTSNCFIVRTLVRAHARRHATTALLVVGRGRGGGRSVGRSLFTQTTLMCLSASLAFVVCVTPSIVLTVGRVRWSVDPASREAYYLARAAAHQLACLNHAINFLLYCLSGQRFRRELVLMLGCGGARRQSWGGDSRVLQQSLSSSSRTPVSPFTPPTSLTPLAPPSRGEAMCPLLPPLRRISCVDVPMKTVEMLTCL